MSDKEECMNKKKIKFKEEKETLLITLYCRAQETKQKNPVIIDKKAVEIIERIDYDFSQLKINSGTYITVCIRGKKIDKYVIDFLKKNQNSIVLSLGSGLDSRLSRIDNGSVIWYDLDFPEVIDIRRMFYKETDRCHSIPSTVMDFKWIDAIQKKDVPVLIIAEGLFMYLKEDEVKSLVLKLQEVFPGSRLIFDCYSELTAKKISGHPSIKKTKAKVYWGLDDVYELEKWNEGIAFIEEWFFTQSEDIKKLKPGFRIMFKIAGCFAIARRAHRILMYQL